MALPLTTSAQVLEQDSLALVALYNSTGGNNWTTKTNWLKPGQPVSTWLGIDVTADGTRIEAINLDNNNLTGQIPEEIGNLYQLNFLGFSSNHLSGTIPSSINNIDKLLYVLLNDNDYTGEIPAFLFQVPLPDEGGYQRNIDVEDNDFTGVGNWGDDFKNVAATYLASNRLDFADIEYFLSESIYFLSYSPQQPIYTADEITVSEGAVLTLKTVTGGSANHYQWLKDGAPIPTALQTDHTLHMVWTDEGSYTAQVTSDIVTELTLERNPVTVHVKANPVHISCDGSPLTLDAAVSDPEATYRWSNGQTSSTITVTTSGKYGVRIETSNYILEDTLETLLHPALSLGPDVDTCEPSTLLSSNISDADHYAWKTPGDGASEEAAITATVPGRYILEVTVNDCTQKDTVEVTLNRFTDGSFIIEAGSVAVENNGSALSDVALTFTNTTGTGEGFTWSFGDNSASSEENTTLHTYSTGGQYTITLNGTDSRNCPITEEKTISVKDLIITNAISPNGDGKNDKLYVEPFLYSAEFKVINRWGQVVYETSSYQDDFTGKNLESGVYYYELHFKDVDKRFKGYFHIMK